MGIVSTGFITITDLSDAPVLNAVIQSDRKISQIYDPGPKSWNPSYATTNMTLTLRLTRAGRTDSILSGVKGDISWSVTTGADTERITSTSSSQNRYIKGGKKEQLVNKVNTPIESGQVRYTASGIWADPVSGLEVPFAAHLDVSVLQLGQAATTPHFYAGSGHIFYNATDTQTLTVNADLYKNGSLAATNKKFSFFVSDTRVSSSSHAQFTELGGIGWRLINTTSGSSFRANVIPSTITTNQGVLTVPHTAVTNFVNVKCFIHDLSDQQATYSGVVEIIDYSDPYTVIVESTAGNIFKNSMGKTTLKARLLQNGNEIDEDGRSSKFTYNWTKRDQNGVQVPSWTSGATRSNAQGIIAGKTITVEANSVDSKATYTVEVIEK